MPRPQSTKSTTAPMTASRRSARIADIQKKALVTLGQDTEDDTTLAAVATARKGRSSTKKQRRKTSSTTKQKVASSFGDAGKENKKSAGETGQECNLPSTEFTFRLSTSRCLLNPSAAVPVDTDQTPANSQFLLRPASWTNPSWVCSLRSLFLQSLTESLVAISRPGTRSAEGSVKHESTACCQNNTVCSPS